MCLIVLSGDSRNSLNVFYLYYQVIAAQEEILKKERELEAARQKLKHIRQAHYLPPSSGSESPSTPKTATTPGLFHS
jgi:I/LWEQ domain